MPKSITSQNNPRLLQITLLIWVADLLIIFGSSSALLERLVPSTFNQVFVSQVAIVAVIVLILGATGIWRILYFNKVQGWVWLAWTSPLWLYNLSAIFAPQAEIPELGVQLAALIMLAVLVGISEEIIYRGLFWQLIRPRGVWVTVTATSVLFGLVHIVAIAWGAPPIVAASRAIFAMGAGFVFAAARLRSGSLLAPILLHIIVDALAFSVFGTTMFDAPDDISSNELLCAMIGFFIGPGVFFGMWGAFAVWRIEKSSRTRQS